MEPCSKRNGVNNRRLLVLGFGNPGRQDDGLGPAIADGLARHGWPEVTVETDYQLNIEHGAMIADHDAVLFVDASVSAKEPFEVQSIHPAPEITFTTHSLSPHAVLAVAEDHFGARPKAWLMGVRGYAFEFAEGLEAQARENYGKAMTFAEALIQVWRRSTMDFKKKTILAIDDDPDIRAALRVVLEAAGFTVGEAANGEEGLQVAQSIKPDAIIVDLMMETVDSGSIVAKKLKDLNFEGPVYMLSSAGDAVQYNVDARELGLAGIFQKPIEPKTLVNTLKRELLGE